MNDKLKCGSFNSYYAGILQNLYAGPDGALMRGMQYRYQGAVLGEFNERFSNVFYDLANRELIEEKRLASLIILAGGDPVYTNAKGSFFSGRGVDYIKDLKQMILVNIENIEKNILDYKLAESKIYNKTLKKELGILAENKKLHLSYLKELLDDI